MLSVGEAVDAPRQPDSRPGRATTLVALADLRGDRHVPFVQASIVDVPLLQKCPPIACEPPPEERVVLSACARIRDDREPLRAVVRVRMCCLRAVIQPQPSLTREETAAVPTIAPRPESESREPRWTADGGPGMSMSRIGNRPTGDLAGEVDEQIAVGRKVAPTLVDAAVKPVTSLERVLRGVPANHLDPLRRTPTKQDRDLRRTCPWDVQSRRRNRLQRHRFFSDLHARQANG